VFDVFSLGLNLSIITQIFSFAIVHKLSHTCLAQGQLITDS
jgi:hypothetical protein